MKTFEEKQKFTQWWIWIILLLLLGISIGGLTYQLLTGQPFGSKPMSNPGFIVICLLIIGLNLLFFLFELKTRVDSDGISYQYRPFHGKMRVIPWSEVSSAEVRQYKPLVEYGGWGLRGFSDNRALNVKGNIGLQLVLKNGDKLLIGTQKGEELSAVLKTFILGLGPNKDKPTD